MRSEFLSVLMAGVVALPANKIQQRQSTVPFGTIITACTVPGTFALTFDDGPYIYTGELLDILASNGVVATFFLNGQNFGDINDFQPQVRRMLSDGHQVGSHTFTHPDLTTLDAAGITSQMNRLDSALLGITGKSPTYMRPPYFSTNTFVLQTLGRLGYHVINANIDTLDYAHDDATIGVALQNFQDGLNAGGTISLMHDVHAQTVYVLIQQAINQLKARGLRTTTVGACLGDNVANWYRGGATPPPVTSITLPSPPATSTAQPPPPASSTPATPPPVNNPSSDGSCGGSRGDPCVGGLCCSQFGWCGSSPQHCSAGCQPLFGTCSGSTAPPTQSSAVSPPSSAPPRPTSTQNASPDAGCGGDNGNTCIGSSFGQCCSQYGWCGSSSLYCGQGCQTGFGRCG